MLEVQGKSQIDSKEGSPWRSVLGSHLRGLLDRFRAPDPRTVDSILSNVGIKRSDQCYRDLKAQLSRLIGRRSKQLDVSTFLRQLGVQLGEKVARRERELIHKAREETRREVEGKLNRDSQQVISEVMAKAFSPSIWAPIDRPTLELLKLLQGGEQSLKSLRRSLEVGNDQIIWRVNHLADLGFVESRLDGDDALHSLSKAGRMVLDKRRAEFEKVVDAIASDKVDRMCLRAVGGDRMMAERFRNLLKGDFRGHAGLIQKLAKEMGGDPGKVSEAFFESRETGDRHEKHFRLKVVDHRAAGELLLMAVGVTAVSSSP